MSAVVQKNLSNETERFDADAFEKKKAEILAWINSPFAPTPEEAEYGSAVVRRHAAWLSEQSRMAEQTLGPKETR